MSAPASVIIRNKDEAKTLRVTLESLHRQSVRPQIIVVDSGSTDGSVPLARRMADVVIEIKPREFTYGRALNIGARAASAPIHFALSAHCHPEREDWIERSLAHYERPEVAGTNGIETFPDGRSVDRPFFQDADYARAHPFWGFSNHASSWRASVWKDFPFDEDLGAAEDREWSWRVLAAGWKLAFDPALWVSIEHRWRTPPRDAYRRTHRENAAIGRLTELPAYGLGDLARDWWGDIPNDRHSRAFHLANPIRLAELLGRYRGRRDATSGAR